MFWSIKKIISTSKKTIVFKFILHFSLRFLIVVFRWCSIYLYCICPYFFKLQEYIHLHPYPFLLIDTVFSLCHLKTYTYYVIEYLSHLKGHFSNLFIFIFYIFSCCARVFVWFRLPLWVAFNSKHSFITNILSLPFCFSND